MANNTKDRACNLHDLLFGQLENIAYVDKKNVQAELHRTKGMCDLADKLINLADLQLRAAQIQSENRLQNDEMPRLLVK